MIKLLLFLLFYANSSYSSDEDMMDAVSQIACESEFAENLVRETRLSHTCTSSINEIISSIISPGTYPMTLTRLIMRDSELFPGNCFYENRVPYNEYKTTKIKFGLCSNIKLYEARLKFLTKAKTWSGDIEAQWDIPKKDYIDIYDKKLGDSFWIYDVLFPYLASIGTVPIPFLATSVFVSKHQDRLCVSVPWLLFGPKMPVGCKFITEPFPVSIYDMNVDNFTSVIGCANDGKNCFTRGREQSQMPLGISGPLFTCANEAVAKTLTNPSTCSGSGPSVNVFGKFQTAMSQAVMGFLTLYILAFGFKIASGGSQIQKKDLILFIIQMCAVIYFSVGVRDSYGNIQNGMVDYVFPIIFGGASQLSSIISSGVSSGLCKYSSGSYMDLWDSIDCRIMHYLGINVITDFYNSLQSVENFRNFGFSVPPYIVLLGAGVYTGNATLISLSLSYPILIFSIAAYIFSLFSANLIIAVILGFLSPIFVPMILFQRTKGYFQGWFKILVSTMLQPIVAVAFLTLMFEIYDMVFYKTCKFEEIPLESKKFFIMDLNQSNYPDKNSYNECISSLGGILNISVAQVKNIANAGASQFKYVAKSLTAHTEKDDVLGSISYVSSLFFSIPIVAVKAIIAFLIELLKGVTVLYIMKLFLEQLNNFSRSLVDGVFLDSMTLNASNIYNQGMQGIGKLAPGKGGPEVGSENIKSSGTQGSRGSISDKVFSEK